MEKKFRNTIIEVSREVPGTRRIYNKGKASGKVKKMRAVIGKRDCFVE